MTVTAGGSRREIGIVHERSGQPFHVQVHGWGDARTSTLGIPAAGQTGGHAVSGRSRDPSHQEGVLSCCCPCMVGGAGVQVVPIELPGHNSRMREPLEIDLKTAASKVVDIIVDLVTRQGRIRAHTC